MGWGPRVKRDNSLFWKGFVEGVAFIMENMEWVIGNGDSINT